MPATGWTNHDAAVLVARHTEIPAAERHDLLAMIGLLDDTGTGVKPDPDAGAAAVLCASVHGATGSLQNAPTGRKASVVGNPPPLNGQHCPPGLRAVIQGGEPVGGPLTPPTQAAPAAPTVKVATPRAPRTPKAATPKPKRTRKPKPPKPPKPKVIFGCGSEAGYRQHVRNGETGDQVCTPCRQARQAADRHREHERTRKAIEAGLRTPKVVARCGTPGGWRKHKRIGTDVCEPCRLARNAERRHYAQARAARLRAENQEQAQAA